MQGNTPEEIEMFETVGNMLRPHGVALLDDGRVRVRKLDKDGMPLDPLPGDPLFELFENAAAVLKWIKRVEPKKSWETPWLGQ